MIDDKKTYLCFVDIKYINSNRCSKLINTIPLIQEECNRLSEEEDRSTEYSGTEGDREDRDREFSTDRDRNTDDDGDRQRLSEESDDERSVTIDENSDR